MRQWFCMPALKEAPAIQVQTGVCHEQRRLFAKFADAVDELLLLHASHSTAVLGGDPSSARFQSLIQSARGKKERAKQAYMEHTQAHGCSRQ